MNDGTFAAFERLGERLTAASGFKRYVAPRVALLGVERAYASFWNVENESREASVVNPETGEVLYTGPTLDDAVRWAARRRITLTHVEVVEEYHDAL